MTLADLKRLREKMNALLASRMNGPLVWSDGTTLDATTVLWLLDAAERALKLEAAREVDGHIIDDARCEADMATAYAKDLEAERDALRARLAGYETLAHRFISKVDRGEAHSHETYHAFKALLAEEPK